MEYFPLCRKIIRFLPFLLFSGCGTTKYHSEIAPLKIDYGNPEAETVVILAQGGPSLKLEEYLIEDIFIHSNLIERDSVHFLQVHQAQTRYPDKFELFEFSFFDAKIYDMESVEYLAQTVSDAVKSGKTIYVVGISFGAFLVQELLATQGNVANGYLLISSRLDWEEAAWRTLSQGISILFADGKTVQPNFQDEEKSANMNKLMAGLGYNRYTEKLDDVRMDNVIFAYGKSDERFGRLNEEEIDFLKSKDTTIYAWEAGKSHSEILMKFLAPCLEEMLGLRSTPVIWSLQLK